jgi:hypothetical protein
MQLTIVWSIIRFGTHHLHTPFRGVPLRFGTHHLHTPFRVATTAPPVCSCSSSRTEVRQEAKDAASSFFTDLWRLNGDRPRGAQSKEYLERVGARELLVASYVSSYDVSSNPTVEEGESMSP